MKGPVRSLPQVKDKIMKYDAFLMKNKQELDSRDMVQSVNQVTAHPPHQQYSHPQQMIRNNIAQPQPSFDDQSSIKRQTETLSNGNDAPFSQREAAQQQPIPGQY